MSCLLALACAASVAACASNVNTSTNRGGTPDHGTVEGGSAGTTGSGGSAGFSGSSAGGSPWTTGGASGSGGSGPPSPACDYVELQPQICATRIGDWPADAGPDPAFGFSQYADLEGTVTDVLSGSPAGCSADYPNYKSTWYARIWDGVRGLEIGLPTASPIVKVGDVLSVFSTRYQPNGFAPLQANAEIRTRDGRLLFWQATAGGISALYTVPEVGVSGGDVFCDASEECGSWEALFTKITSSGSSVFLGPGGTAQVGEYAVAAGGIAIQTSSYHSVRLCADWGVGIVSALAVRTTLANLTP